MNNINISKKKYDSLKKIELPKDIVSTEAAFYKLNYLGKVKVFKNLYRTSGPIFANKLFIIEMLNAYREILPHNFILPESLVSVDKEIKGFILPFANGVNLEIYLADRNVIIKDKLMAIQKIGNVLEHLNHIRKNSSLDSIYLNDLHASNFIVDPKTNDIKVVDLDSCKICDSKPLPARYLNPHCLLNRTPGQNKYDIYRKNLISNSQYQVSSISKSVEHDKGYYKYANYRDELGYINSNEESDLYCYTILFLNYLYGENINRFSLEQFYDYICYLEKIGFNQKLLEAMIKIVTNVPNENIGSYLNMVTEEQVVRANKKVYQIAKGRI